MNRSKFIDGKISGLLTSLSEQRYLQAIKAGISTIMPVIVVGTLLLLLVYPPFPSEHAISEWALLNRELLLYIYRVTVGLAYFFGVYSFSDNLAKYYNIDGISLGWISVIAMFLVIMPNPINQQVLLTSIKALGSYGLILAIFVSILTVEIYRFAFSLKKRLTLVKGIPPAVYDSLLNLVPIIAVIVVMVFVNKFLSTGLIVLLYQGLDSIIRVQNTWVGAMIPIVLITVFWATGVHGASVVGMILRPIWLVILTSNANHIASGGTSEGLVHIVSEPFYQWFVWIGGSGSTIGLAIVMVLFSKSKNLKSVGKSSIVPSIFNINEGIIFGTPIVLNPILVIPFITTPLILGSIAYLATSLGMVNRMYILAPWTLPGPIGAYIASGGDWRAFVLNLVLIVISCLLYYPFFKAYDRQLKKEEV